MKIRIDYAIAVCCFAAVFALAQAAGLEGTWTTDGVPAFEAAKKAKKDTNGLAEATIIKFKVDVKKNKITGNITQLNTDKEFDIVDGVLMGNTFTFNSVEVVGFSNNRGGPFGNTSGPAPMSWKGELTDANTVTLKRASATGDITVVYHRAKK